MLVVLFLGNEGRFGLVSLQYLEPEPSRMGQRSHERRNDGTRLPWEQVDGGQNLTAVCSTRLPNISDKGKLRQLVWRERVAEYQSRT